MLDRARAEIQPFATNRGMPRALGAAGEAGGFGGGAAVLGAATMIARSRFPRIGHRGRNARAASGIGALGRMRGRRSGR
jgi:hypothetical protein